MTEWWQVVLAVVGGLVVVWLVLVGALLVAARRAPDAMSLRGALRLVPDVLRLLKRLVADRTVPRGTRLWLGALLVYLLMPIDLIPDFIPVLGYADDVLVVAIAVRFAVSHAGEDSIQRHWPGTPEGLAAVRSIAFPRSA
ncbi:YkvA family protein [Microbacteriaceae bacterium 4G12]